MKKEKRRSWKTTLSGWLCLIGAILVLYDRSWSQNLMRAGMVIWAIGNLLGFICARDHAVSSKSAGVDEEEK